MNPHVAFAVATLGGTAVIAAVWWASRYIVPFNARYPMPLWLLRARTWRKRRKSAGRDDIDRLTLAPHEHLILAHYEGTNR